MAMAEGPETKPDTTSDQNSSIDLIKEQSQGFSFDGVISPNDSIPMCPIMYPALVPGLFSPQMDQTNRGRGLYAVPVLPFSQPITGFPTNPLIPFTYNIPTAQTSSGSGGVGPEQGQVQQGEQPQQQQEARPQRQVVVRRFQIAIQLDLLLILKLAAVIFLFNQDGSKQRLILLLFFASVVYFMNQNCKYGPLTSGQWQQMVPCEMPNLQNFSCDYKSVDFGLAESCICMKILRYQTGALAPVIRWLSERTQRAVVRPQPPRAAIRADNLPAAEGQGNEHAGLAGAQPTGINENHQADDGEPHGQVEAGNRWWGIVKEIQIIVFGFITSLLPGFNNLD